MKAQISICAKERYAENPLSQTKNSPENFQKAVFVGLRAYPKTYLQESEDVINSSPEISFCERDLLSGGDLLWPNDVSNLV